MTDKYIPAVRYLFYLWLFFYVYVGHYADWGETLAYAVMFNILEHAIYLILTGQASLFNDECVIDSLKQKHELERVNLRRDTCYNSTMLRELINRQQDEIKLRKLK